jgi:hypothetical protein
MCELSRVMAELSRVMAEVSRVVAEYFGLSWFGFIRLGWVYLG